MPQAKQTTGKMVKAKSPAAKTVKPIMAKKDAGKMSPKEKFLAMINSKKKKK